MTMGAPAHVNEADNIRGYQLESLLGRGTFGQVYKARQRSGGSVALKMIDCHGAPERHLVEPEILRSLKHPNIVELRDFFLHGDALALVMEFVPGSDLQQYIARGTRFSVEQVMELLVQMTGALQQAHRQRIWHRDIKPANILLDDTRDRNRWVLADFGIAYMSEAIQFTSHPGGTRDFMAPEQVLGRPSAQSDLWALGIIAYLMLEGRLPFSGSNWSELRNQILYHDPPLPQALVGSDSPLRRVLPQLLEKRLEARTQSADELLAQLSSHNQFTPANDSKQLADEATRQSSAATSWALGILFTSLMGISSLWLGSALVVTALLLLARSYRGNNGPLRAGAVVLLCVGAVADFFGATVVQKLLQTRSDALHIVTFLAFVGPAIYYLNKATRQRAEEQFQAALAAAAANPEQRLSVLKEHIDSNAGDIRLQQRYAEALFATGNVEAAAAEAMDVLGQDPYNFSSSLLLAHSYFELGLPHRCVGVCDGYPKISGYCFEFAELRARCLNTMRGPHAV
jgi:tRNA A-37 threonylcarbamoyl transferase component Bud32/tetratricopeptide (TPR) repeat protein